MFTSLSVGSVISVSVMRRSLRARISRVLTPVASIDLFTVLTRAEPVGSHSDDERVVRLEERRELPHPFPPRVTISRQGRTTCPLPSTLPEEAEEWQSSSPLGDVHRDAEPIGLGEHSLDLVMRNVLGMADSNRGHVNALLVIRFSSMSGGGRALIQRPRSSGPIGPRTVSATACRSSAM